MRIRINKKNTEHFEGGALNNHYVFAGYICPSCGTELYGLWITDKMKNYKPVFPKGAEEEQIAICNLKNCPVCDGELNKNDKKHPSDALYSCPIWFDGFKKQKEPIKIDPHGNAYLYGFSQMFVPNTWKNIHKAIDYLYNQARECVQNGYKSQAATRIANNLESWNSSKGMIEKKIDLLAIKSSPEALKNHIMQLLQLEANIYTLKQHLEDLYVNEIQLNRTITERRFSSLVQYKQKINDLTAQEIIPEKNEVIIPQLPEAPQYPVLKDYNMFNKRKIETENEALRKEYNEKYKDYQKKTEEYQTAEKRWQEENIRLFQEAEERHKKAILEAQKEFDKAKTEIVMKTGENQENNQLITSEIQQAEQLLELAIQAKNDLYSIGVIYGKYQNPVALSTFYEYLASGRCESLEGANGAYNIYEAEIRADRIISQLDNVLSSLEQIKQNQYMIYNAITAINSELSSLSGKMHEAVGVLGTIKDNAAAISSNSKMIAYNTARTAYYAKRETEISDALGYLVALK